MALQKQNLSIPFAQGLDTKTDPKQVSPGKFLQLQNSIFQKGGLLQKRNGFASVTTLGTTSATALTTYNGNLVATGDALYAYSPDTMSILNKGSIVPINLEVLPVIRTSSAQNTVDVAVTSDGLICSVWEDSDGSKYYQIVDSNNGNTVVARTALPTGSHLPRVFLLGRYFIVTFLITITATPHLRYIAIPISNPSNPGSATDISTQVATNTTAYDGQVINNNLFIAWNASDVGGAVRLTSLSQSLTVATSVANATVDAVAISICGDTSGNSPIVWLSFIDSSANIKTRPYNTSLIAIRAIVAVASSTSAVNLTSTATSNVVTIFYEVSNTYAYNSIRTDFIKSVTVNTAGTVGTPAVVLRGVGLGSKAFWMNSVSYMLVAYAGTYEPTYFLMNSSGAVVAKLAPENGGGYPITNSNILPNFNLNEDSVSIGYLFKAQVTAVNKTQDVASVGGLYGQLGINLSTFTFASTVQALEIGGSLHINGGYLRMYDGVIPVEHNFHLWPEDIGSSTTNSGGGLKAQQYFYQATYEWTDSQGNVHRSAPSIPLDVLITGNGTALTFTSVFSSGATSITVSSASGLHVGQVITDNTTGGNITAGTAITSISGTTVGLSLPTAGNSAVSPGDTLQSVQTWKATIKVPTLRITSKTAANKVRIVLYRWSTDQQNYYQTTSIQSPTINDTTTDSVSIDDTNNDAEIIGNPLIYTTGGVVENLAAPACNAMTLYKSRLLLINAENTNEVWFSKQVIQNTPVEMSDLLTEFIAPTIGAEESTGSLDCLFAMDEKKLLFKSGAIYYGVGNGPDNTGANNDFSEPVFITSTVGCSNQTSLVFMPNGVMFQSNKGIWLLGRDLSTSYIGAPVEDFTTDATVLSAVTVPATNQVRFILDSGITLMYDYYYGQWGSFQGSPAIASTIYQGKHTLLNSLGRILQETDNFYLDNTSPTLMKFQTGWMSLAGLQGFQRAYGFYLLGQFITPHKIMIEVAYNYDPAFQQSVIISPDNFSPNYGNDSLYGSASPFGGLPSLEQWQVFLKIQKCQAFQLTITEIYDPSYDVPNGAGFTLSGINLQVGVKSGVPRLAARYSAG